MSQFLKNFHARILEQMLQDEQATHLDYKNHSAESYLIRATPVRALPSGKSRPNPAKIPSKSPVTAMMILNTWSKHQSRSLPSERLVVSLDAKGLSVSGIGKELRNMYRINLSSSAFSVITNKVTGEQHPNGITVLWSMFIWWCEWMTSSLRSGKSDKVINKTVYLCAGLTDRGYKEALGI